MKEEYLIGDTIRFVGEITNLDGEPFDPVTVTVTVFRKNGECLLEQKPANKVSKGNYKYDWKIGGSEEEVLEQKSDLIVVWDWSGPHKKRYVFKVIPQV